ncbi:MAG: sarcosine oxidase subunit gamma [Gemmobacter sp.]
MTTADRHVRAAGVTIDEVTPAPRFSLRLRPEGVAEARAALGVDLPGMVGRLATAGGRRALCLGPDEWMLDCPEGDRPALPATLPHALVDISDREISWRIRGARATELLSIGIARDLAALVPGRGCRTAFGTVQAVLVRDAEDAFTLSVWRSFAPHVAEMLAIGQRELACGL